MNLNQVTVPARDLNASIEFYKKMGLQLIVEATPHYARFLCPDGSSTFSVHHEPELPEESSIWVYFECKDVDLEYDRLKGEGVEFIHKPKNQPWLWREARLHDPDGNFLILYHGGENRINPPWKVK